MSLALRILNGLLALFMVHVAIGVGQDSGEPAQAFGALLWTIPPLTTLLALGANASDRLRSFAFWANLVSTIGFVGIAAFASEKHNAVAMNTGVVVISTLFVTNLWTLSRLRRPVEAPDRDVVPYATPHAGATPSYEMTGGGVSALVADSPSSSGYVVRHWRGELPLPTSYWVNSVLLSIGIFVLLGIAGVVLKNVQVRTAAIIGVLLLGPLPIVIVWSAVGIWRSASRHVSRGGRAAWAVLAQIVTVVGVLLTLPSLLTNLMPTLKEYALIAVDRDPLAPIDVGVTADGGTMVLRGMFGTGSAERVRQHLAQSGSIRTLMLDSPGGRLREARDIADLVRQRGLDTYIETHCESACTYVFLAGAERAATPNARIGFHQPGFAGFNVAVQREATKEMLEVYRASGLPQSFLDRIAQTENKSMWHPTSDELVESNVVTRLSLGGETSAASTFAMRSRRDLETAFRSSALLVAIDERFPGTMKEAIDAAWLARSRGSSDADVSTAARRILATAYPKLLVVADDESLDSFLDLMVDQLNAAQAVSDEACGALLESRLDITKVLPAELAGREQRWAMHVLQSPEGERTPVPDEQEFQAALEPVYARVPAELQNVMYDLVAYRDRPKLQCDAAVVFYQAVSELPDEPRHVTLRGLFSRPQQE
jgi:hypothetical protein